MSYLADNVTTITVGHVNITVVLEFRIILVNQKTHFCISMCLGMHTCWCMSYACDMMITAPFSFTIKLKIHHLYLFIIAHNFFVVVAIVVIMLTPFGKFCKSLLMTQFCNNAKKLGSLTSLPEKASSRMPFSKQCIMPLH